MSPIRINNLFIKLYSISYANMVIIIVSCAKKTQKMRKNAKKAPFCVKTVLFKRFYLSKASTSLSAGG